MAHSLNGGSGLGWKVASISLAIALGLVGTIFGLQVYSGRDTVQLLRENQRSTTALEMRVTRLEVQFDSIQKALSRIEARQIRALEEGD